MLIAPNVTAKVDSRCGARISSLRFNNREVIVTNAKSPLDWGIYPMVPFAGRIRNGSFEFDGEHYRLDQNAFPHAMHGTLFDVPWDIREESESSMMLAAALDDRWPFRGVVTHRVSVMSSYLRCELTVEAIDRMPVQVGWHPWFAQPRNVTSEFRALLKRDADGITSTEESAPSEPPFDDCFVQAQAWPRVQIEECTLEIASDCSHWVRYDAPLGDVCIEPQSGPPNQINEVPTVIDAGESLTRWMEIRLVSASEVGAGSTC